MDCKKAENLVTDYINGSIGLHDLEDFIAHVKCCSSCYDELQTYFTVYFAMEHLENEDNNPPFNMNTVLVEDLKKKERYVKGEKYKRYFLLAISILMFLVVLFLLIG